jgi:hypothetical protein
MGTSKSRSWLRIQNLTLTMGILAQKVRVRIAFLKSVLLSMTPVKLASVKSALRKLVPPKVAKTTAMLRIMAYFSSPFIALLAM